MLLGTTIGGVGTLMGPIVGAFILTPLGEGLTVLIQPFQNGGLRLDGMKQVFYGICVVAIDITKRKEAEEQYRQALAILEKLAAG